MKIETKKEKDGDLYVMIQKDRGEPLENLIESLCNMFLAEIAPLHPEEEWNCIHFSLDPIVGRCLVFPGRHDDYARDERGLCDSFDPDVEDEYDKQSEGLSRNKDYTELHNKYLSLYKDVICKIFKNFIPIFKEKIPQYQFIEIAEFHEEGDILLETSFEELSA